MLQHTIRAIAPLLCAAMAAAAPPDSYSPAAGQAFPANVYWGDTHVHSSLSADANVMGNTALPPQDAYRFARGETVIANNGMQARLNRPLDFLVVADHGAFLGMLPALRAKGDAQAVADAGQRFFQTIMAEEASAADTDRKAREIMRSTWQQSLRAAEAANEPGRFTALAGFEWTSMPGGNNLHRVVVFRDGPDRTGQVVPFSSLDSQDPADLWAYLQDYETKTGGAALAIPHNGNVSNGAMFAEVTRAGEPIDRDYAERRARWEPLMEVTQIKGDGETHPLLSPNDEFADYGTWDTGNLGMTALKQQWMLQYEYARSALKLGLRLERQTGVNPYRFGLIGSTDAHTSLATAEEDNFWGKSGIQEPGSELRTQGPFMIFKDAGEGIFEGGTWKKYQPSPEDRVVESWEQVAAGYAAVWAEANTREAIFDALRRREVYATTGPRMTVRFFGGWRFGDADVQYPDYARRAYRKGIPMGAELPARPDGVKAPTFLVAALKDPEGANLDRVQVVKGWLGSDGETLHEKVYDVAWSGPRKPDRKGRLPAVGNTVDLKEASYRNSIGAPQLATTWRDPDFDPRQRAFYYVRVLEIPTPRWIVYDQKRLGSRIPDDAERIHQERAYTSPIWYGPAQKVGRVESQCSFKVILSCSVGPLCLRRRALRERPAWC